MNNTCRIAAGHLGGLLARQRPVWDFHEAHLTENGRSALWFIMKENLEVEQLLLSENEIHWDDVIGLSVVISSCPKLHTLDLSGNELHKLIDTPDRSWRRICEALYYNRTLTDLNLNHNLLGPMGARMTCNALRGLKTLKWLGFSHNEPGTEPALAELLRQHPSLTAIELVEDVDRHLPTRIRDELGRALLERDASNLCFLHCDSFVLGERTRKLTWPAKASTSDAVLLAGCLQTNTVLTTFDIAHGATLEIKARSVIGQALLDNPKARVAFCNDFGLTPSVDTVEFDLSLNELRDVDSFRVRGTPSELSTSSTCHDAS